MKWLRLRVAEDGRSRSSGVRSRGKGFNKKDLPLSDWEIHESEIEICKRPDGTLWHLGAGSFGQVFKAMRGGVQPVAGETVYVCTCKAISLVCAAICAGDLPAPMALQSVRTYCSSRMQGDMAA